VASKRTCQWLRLRSKEAPLWITRYRFFRFCLLPSHDVPHRSSPACTQSDQTRQSDSSFPDHDSLSLSARCTRSFDSGTDVARGSVWMELARSNSSCCRSGGRNRARNWVDIIAMHDSNYSRNHLWNLILVDGLLGPVIEESFSVAACSVVAPRLTDHGRLSHRYTLCHTPPISTFVQWLCFVSTGLRLDGSESNRDPPRHRL